MSDDVTVDRLRDDVEGIRREMAADATRLESGVFWLRCILNDTRRKLLEVWPGAVGGGGSGKTGVLVPITALTGSGITASTTSWVRTQGTAVSWDGPRTAYDPTNHIYYSITRKCTWDSRGNLYSIGIEIATNVVTLVLGTCV